MLIREHALNLHIAGHEDTGITLLRRACDADPNDRRARTILAGALLEKGESEEAKGLIDSVLREEKRDPHAWNVLGTYYFTTGRTLEAIAAYKASVAIMPENGAARFDYCLALLAGGDYTEGFKQYEARHMLTAPRRYNLPEWDGRPTKHLYVWAEQGAGDTFAFVRFVAEAAKLCDKLTFSTFSPLFSLMRGYEKLGNVTVIDNPSTPPEVDHHISLHTLPRVLGITRETLPPDPGLMDVPAIVGGIPPSPGRKRVGICWAGTATHPKDKIRSLPFQAMLRLAADSLLDLYSFQVGPRAADVNAARAQRVVSDLSGFLDGDWAVTAAWLKTVDVLVTADTGIAHLAGCMGIPVMVCVYASPYWIWGDHGTKTPWYPSATLFRQKRLGDWGPVIADIAAALRGPA